MKIILWLLRACSVQDVPSYNLLRKTQETIRNNAGIPTLHRKTPKGNTFSFNDPRALLANVSNDSVCSERTSHRY